MTDGSSLGRHVVWVLVDQSSRELTFESVATVLGERDVETHIVTITEVIGSMAKGALAGGAERLLRGLRVAIKGHSDEDLVGAIRRDRPDLLVVTDARYVRALGLLENLTGTPSLQVGVFADYNVTADWEKSSIHAFVVPHESFKAKMMASGVAEDRIQVAGPPIQARFAADPGRDAARASFGFDDQKVVLVRANGFDSATLDKLVFQATLADTEAQYIFHHDGDQVMASALRRSASQYGLRALMFGQVDDFPRYLSSADLVIAAPGDSYVAEIVALDRPLLFLGDEGDHLGQVEFLTSQGAAVHVADLLRLGTELDRSLDDESLAAASAAAAELSQKTGSQDVADALMVALEHREEWLVEPVPVSGPEEEPATDDEVPAGSAFEAIGSTHPTSKPETDDKISGKEKRDFRGVSKAEAKEQLAALILLERDLERQLEDVEKQQERWRNRLELAREWNEDDLASEAEEILRGYLADAEKVGTELSDVRTQKSKLKTAARGGAPEPADDESSKRSNKMEGRFRKMEIDSDLKDLKDRIRRELGE